MLKRYVLYQTVAAHEEVPIERQYWTGGAARHGTDRWTNDINEATIINHLPTVSQLAPMLGAGWMEIEVAIGPRLDRTLEWLCEAFRCDPEDLVGIAAEYTNEPHKEALDRIGPPPWEGT